MPATDARGRDALAFRAEDHPDGTSSLSPCFRLLDSPALATEDHEACASDLPWYDLRGSVVYPAIGHPAGASYTPCIKRGSTDYD